VDYLPAPDEVEPAKAFHLKKEEELEVPCKTSGYPWVWFSRFSGTGKPAPCATYACIPGLSTIPASSITSPRKKGAHHQASADARQQKRALDSVEAGDIAVLVGLKNAQTGDTIGTEGWPVVLERMHFPEPVISVSIEPKTLSDREKLKETLDILSREDPTFATKDNEETGQLIISGMGELHIDVLVTRMIRDFKVQAKVGNPQVTYRESITKEVRHREEFSKVLAGKENKPR
jgi:elongation factor G